MAEIIKEGTKVWVTASVTVNLGNYESAKLEMGFNRDYGAEHSALNMADSMAESLEELLQEHVRKLKKLGKLKKRKIE